ERLKLELRRRHAECQKAEAQVDVARTVTARNQHLNTRKPGMVSEHDVAKAEAELKVAGATVAIAEAGVAEVSLRIKQLQRRRGKIRDVVALADRVKTARGTQ